MSGGAALASASSMVWNWGSIIGASGVRRKVFNRQDAKDAKGVLQWPGVARHCLVFYRAFGARVFSSWRPWRLGG
jgi:hypothetical protein